MVYLGGPASLTALRTVRRSWCLSRAICLMLLPSMK